MEYVCVYARPVNCPETSTVLLVLKDRPEWQKGRFNLPGGKIEDGETPLEASVRELKEESGLDPLSKPRIIGKITGSWGTVHCVRLAVHLEETKPQNGETEVVDWVNWFDIRNDHRLIPNLRVVLPMMMMNIEDWVVYDEGPTWKEDTHKIMVEVKSGKIIG